MGEIDDDLAGLPEDVREAVVAIDNGNGVFVDSDDGIGGEKWRTVRAELLRLARENTELHAAIEVAEPALRERAERAEAANRDCVDHFVQMKAELEALKQRIAEAKVMRSTRNGVLRTDVGAVAADSIFALLPVGGE